MAELYYARFRFWHGYLEEADLEIAHRLAVEGKYRNGVRAVFGLRGAWALTRGLWRAAIESLGEAVRMAREIGRFEAESEVGLALARFKLGELSDPRVAAELLAETCDATSTAPLSLAQLWLQIGDEQRAAEFALKAYRRAWSDGEPYVFRYGLEKAREMIVALRLEVPTVPRYDARKDERFAWEDALEAANNAAKRRELDRWAYQS